ncbi:MAG: cofactor assembly of complex C subunit B [Cyanobacteria bacterium J06634_6]
MIFTDPTRVSTLLLTALMVIGLGFFIRASTKDRIETMEFGSSQSAEPLAQDVLSYFQSRAYRQVVPAAQSVSQGELQTGDSITVAGMVSPSVFMAVFLTTLAAIGFACLGLILATLFPAVGTAFFGFVLVSPLAGVFYWRKSSRPEKVVFKVEPHRLNSKGEKAESADLASVPAGVVSKLTVKGHRDELAELKNAFSSVLKAWS